MIDDTKKFIERMTVFLVILVTFMLILNFVFVETIAKQRVVYRKEVFFDSYLKKNSNKVEYAFFGDSHLLNAINPDYIPNSFNLASSGELNLEIYYRFKDYIKKGIKFDKVFFEIDLHTFSKKPGKFKTQIPEFHCKIIPYEDIKIIYNASLFSYWMCKYDMFFGYGGDIITRIISPKVMNMSNLGWMGFEDNFSALSDKDKQEILRIRHTGHFDDSLEIDKNSFEYIYFNKTIELAKQENLTIIFIQYPVTKDYEEYAASHNISKENYYRTLFKLINSSVKDYYVLDYSQIYFNKTYYFADPNHLSIAGSEEFSKKVNEDLKKLFPKNINI